MNHKRGRAKNQRAGCLLCKPHKANGAKNPTRIADVRACGRADVAAGLAEFDYASPCERRGHSCDDDDDTSAT